MTGSGRWLGDGRLPGLLFFTLAAWFLTVVMLGGAMAPGYVIGPSAISDLGVIDESALLFNLTLVGVGVLEALAGILYFRIHRRTAALAVALVAAAGAIGAGLVPLDQGAVHGISALVAFLAFNLQPLVVARLVSQPLRALSWLAGIVGLAFVVLMVIGDAGNEAVFGPIGHGGAERLIVYPALLWLLALGGYLMGAKAPPSEP
jgi:hypothetical membrane protein